MVTHHHPATLRAFLLDRCHLPEAEIEWLEAAGKPRLLKRGDVFCGIGQQQHELGVVHRGILQVYAVSVEGKHVVLDFVVAGMMALALSSALRGVPSEVAFEAVTPCRLSVWPYELRLAAFRRHAEWRRLAARMTEEAFLRKQQNELALRMYDARERFRQATSAFPDQGRAIPQHVLASFLSITPQYLSRLKKEAVSFGRPDRSHPTSPLS